MERKKILISCVGKRDPFADDNDSTEGAILTSIRSLKPDIVYLLPTMRKANSTSNTEKNAEDVRAMIETINEEDGISIEVYIRALDIVNPTDYASLREEIHNKVSVIYNENMEAEFYYSISSGTNQMTSIWLVLKNNGCLKGDLYKVSDPRFIDNPTPENRVKKIEMNFMEEDNIIVRSKNFIKNYTFEYSANELEKLSEITGNEKRKFMSEIFSEVFKAYNYWEQLNYKVARAKINKIANRISSLNKYQTIFNLLSRQEKFLLKLIKAQNENLEDKYILLDFYFMLKRHYLKNDYSATLARFWRIYEGCIYYILRKEYNIEARCLNDSGNKKLAREISRKYGTKMHYSLSLAKGAEFLKEENNEVYKKLIDTELIKLPYRTSVKDYSLADLLDELRIIRNNCSIGHGLKPVEGYRGEQAVIAGKEILMTVFDIEESSMDNYCFNDTFINLYLEYMDKI
ncbi:MAG: hypothetical protein ACOCRK_10140 [bacterium]